MTSVKRFCEPKEQRRSWLIWFFDTSKQGIGAAVIHFANVFLASMFQGDPCTWYIISFLLDSSVGLLIIWIGLKMCNFWATWKGYDLLHFGEYGTPPKIQAWLGQSGLYILVMLVEKFLVTLLTLPKFWKRVREVLMYPITNPKVELVIVVLIIPFIVNAFVFWVVDNFLKRHIKSSSSMPSTPTSRYVRAKQKDDSDSEILLSVEEEDVVIESRNESYRLLNSTRS